MSDSVNPSVRAAIEQTQRAVAALLGGDPEPEKALWSRRDDITLANPAGGSGEAGMKSKLGWI